MFFCFFNKPVPERISLFDWLPRLFAAAALFSSNNFMFLLERIKYHFEN